MGKLKAPATSEALFELLSRAQFLTPQQLESVRNWGNTIADPTSLGRKLVLEKVLTKWQASQLLSGFTGFVVGPYRLCDHVGKDAISRTYRAERISDGRALVMRIPLTKFAQDASFRQRFIRDGNVAAGLAHTNVVRLVDVRSDTDPCLVVTELPHGIDLQSWVVNRGPLTAPQVERLVTQVLRALDAVHGVHLVHGDVRPSNVFCTEEIDFELAYFPCGRELQVAAALEDAAAADAVPRPGDFTSPEQVSACDPNLQSDLYSLGQTAHFAAVGKLAYSEGTADERRKARCFTCMPSLARQGDEWNRVSRFIARVCATNPQDRPATISDAVAVLADPISDPADRSAAANISLPVAILQSASNSSPTPLAPPTSSGPSAPATPSAMVDRRGEDHLVDNEIRLAPLENRPTQQSAIQSTHSNAVVGNGTVTENNVVARNATSNKATSAGPAILVDGKSSVTLPLGVQLEGVKIQRVRRSERTGESRFRAIARKSNLPGLILGGISVVGLLITLAIGGWILFGTGTQADQVAEGPEAVPGPDKTDPPSTNSQGNSTDAAISDVPPEIVPDAAIGLPPVSQPPLGPSSFAAPAQAAPTPTAAVSPHVSTANVPAPVADPNSNKPTAPAPTAPTPTTPTPTAPSPETSTPPTTPEPLKEPKPNRPMGKPFQKFPQVVELPPVESPEPVVLGQILIGERDLCFIKLKGAEGLTKGRMRFGIRNAQDGTAERDWEITYGAGASTAVVATLKLSEQMLRFTWAESITQPNIVGNLRNAVINLNAGPETHDVILRRPQRVAPLNVQIERGETKERWLLESLPPAESLRLQVTSVAGGQKVVLVPAEINLSNGSQLIWIGERVEDAVFGLRMDATVSGKNLQLSFMPHFQTIMSGRPTPFNKGNVKKVNAQLSVLPKLRVDVEALKKMQAESKKKSDMQNQVLDAQKRLSDMETALQQHEKLKEVVEPLKGNCEVRFRLFYRADDREVVLMEASP